MAMGNKNLIKRLMCLASIVYLSILAISLRRRCNYSCRRLIYFGRMISVSKYYSERQLHTQRRPSGGSLAFRDRMAAVAGAAAQAKRPCSLKQAMIRCRLAPHERMTAVDAPGPSKRSLPCVAGPFARLQDRMSTCCIRANPNRRTNGSASTPRSTRAWRRIAAFRPMRCAGRTTSGACMSRWVRQLPPNASNSPAAHIWPFSMRWRPARSNGSKHCCGGICAPQLFAAELSDAAGLTDTKFRYRMSDTKVPDLAA